MSAQPDSPLQRFPPESGERRVLIGSVSFADGARRVAFWISYRAVGSVGIPSVSLWACGDWQSDRPRQSDMWELSDVGLEDRARSLMAQMGVAYAD